MTQHELKILPEYFVAVRDGIKKFEVRKDDRAFEVGDILCLHEINCGVLTGRTIKAEVTYVLRHPDYCKEGYCILSIKVAQQQVVKHGKWDTHDVVKVLCSGETLDGFCQCESCGDVFPYHYSRYSYCPNCGTRMDGGADDENI